MVRFDELSLLDLIEHRSCNLSYPKHPILLSSLYSLLFILSIRSSIVPLFVSLKGYLKMKKLLEGIVPHIVPVFFGIRFEERINVLPNI